MTDNHVLAPVRDMAHLLRGDADDFDFLLHQFDDVRFVLLGEASHGTREFYEQRARITRRLIEEKGFSAVAVEADWPDAYRVNCYARGASDDASAEQALNDFERFPAWMWRNHTVADFVGWLREHNQIKAAKVGFYGLDLYSLHASMEAVTRYLERADPDAAARAKERYACFEPFGENTQQYGLYTSLGLSPSCEDEAVAQLVELQKRAANNAAQDNRVARDQEFYAQQNAKLVVDAERYYGAMFAGRDESWNLRDTHMADTLDALAAHLGEKSKIVVWAHNSHLGDARATEMGRRGEINLGQLMRERHPGAVRIVGFSTDAGEVMAASDWDSPAQRQRVRPALSNSYEALFHRVAQQIGDFGLDLRQDDAREALAQPRLQRAIGVVYRPETERLSHYFQAHLPQQFDAILHYDQTSALEPLEPSEVWRRGEDSESQAHALVGEAPETYPLGL